MALQQGDIIQTYLNLIKLETFEISIKTET